jgi:hypothetical protein
VCPFLFVVIALFILIYEEVNGFVIPF